MSQKPPLIFRAPIQRWHEDNNIKCNKNLGRALNRGLIVIFGDICGNHSVINESFLIETKKATEVTFLTIALKIKPKSKSKPKFRPKLKVIPIVLYK